MGKAQLIKFRHGSHKGIFHYVQYDNAFVALSEANTSKIEYIKKTNSLDITFDLQGETYDVMSVDVIEDESYIQEVYDFMLNTDNTYFKNGIEGLCVLKFHK